MTSQINPNNIDGNYPVAGQDNNSQGMRDNFTNIKVNFQDAAAEITDIQNKGIFKSALTGTTLDNNMLDAQIYAAQIRDFSATAVSVAATSGAILINYVAGHYQSITTSGSISLSFTNFPPAGQYGYVKLQINITNVAHTVTLPAAVTLGLSGLQGYSAGTITFGQAGVYEFGFGSANGGVTITIFDLNRGLTNFSGADLLIDDITASGNISATGATSLISSAGNITAVTNITAGATVSGGNVTALGSVSAAGNVSGSNVTATTAISTTGTVFGTTVQGFLRPTSGTGSQAPLQFATGSNLSTPAAGAWEYDGQTFYASPTANQRAVVPVDHFVILNTAYTGANSTAAQQVFNVPANGAVTLAANTTYFFEGLYYITRSAGTTSHTLSTLFALGGTLNSITYLAETTSTAGNILSSDSRIYITAATATAVTAASTAADENITVHLRGVVRTNTEGTFTPQIQYSAAPGGAPTILANSFFRLTPVGSALVTSVGNWT
jgi:hypothetical protein